MALELVNTAVVDLVTEEHRPLAKDRAAERRTDSRAGKSPEPGMKVCSYETFIFAEVSSGTWKRN